MGLSESSTVGRSTSQSSEAVMGLLLQDPESQTQAPSMDGGSDPGAETAVAVKVTFSTPFLIEVVCHGAETNGQTHNFSVFNKDCPFKLRVVSFWGVVLDETGTIAGDTVQLQRGDGASGESFTNITNTVDCNVSDDVMFGVVHGTDQFFQDEAVIDTDESLRIQMVLVDSTDHNVAVKLFILCARTVADE